MAWALGSRMRRRLYSECGDYSALVAAGKPVFHIEYNGFQQSYCVSGFSTVFKNLSLDGYVQYCDQSSTTTPTTGGSTGGGES